QGQLPVGPRRRLAAVAVRLASDVERHFHDLARPRLARPEIDVHPPAAVFQRERVLRRRGHQGHDVRGGLQRRNGNRCGRRHAGVRDCNQKRENHSLTHPPLLRCHSSSSCAEKTRNSGLSGSVYWRPSKKRVGVARTPASTPSFFCFSVTASNLPACTSFTIWFPSRPTC